MSVYVDPIVVHAPSKNAQVRRVGANNGHRWCHLIADTSEELLAFALKLSMRPAWIQYPGTEHEHFDLTPQRRAVAVQLGAIEVDSRKIIEIIRGKRAQMKAAL